MPHKIYPIKQQSSMGFWIKLFSGRNENRQFHDAAAEGWNEKVLKHIEGGIDVNSRNPSGGTALMIAAKRGHLRAVQSLLQSGANPNIVIHGAQAYQALNTAAQEGHNQIVAALLDYEAAINAETRSGETALISAAFFGRNSIVQLSRGGADPYKTVMGMLASDWERENGHVQCESPRSSTRTKESMTTPPTEVSGTNSRTPS